MHRLDLLDELTKTRRWANFFAFCTGLLVGLTLNGIVPLPF